MKTKITRELLRDLKASAGDTIHDTELKGFCVRVGSTGRTFYIVKRVGPKLVYRKIGDCALMTVTEARDAARTMLAQIELGDTPIVAARGAEKTLRDFIDGTYGDYLATKQKRPEDTKSRLSTAFADYMDTRLENLTTTMMDRWNGAMLKAGRTPSSCNRYMSDLRALCAYAVDRGLLKEHPLKSVKKVAEAEDHRVRYLSKAEETALREALDQREEEKRAARERGNQWLIERNHDARADLKLVAYVDHLKPAVLLSMNTGMRQGELFQLTWANVDLVKGMLTVRAATAKANKTRHIPLNQEARTVLKEWRLQSTDPLLVFPGKDGKPLSEVKTSFAKLLKRAGIVAFRWHDLRHHFASRLVMAGVDLNTVRELMGHADLKMTLRYAHLAPEHKAAAVELISGVAA